MERIGVMGGTFNPIHEGHLVMARKAMEQAQLSRVMFIPTGRPPHKHEGLASAEDRYQMMLIAISQEKGFEPSRIELDRKGVIYSVDTLTLLHKRFPGAAFFFIIGEDTLHELPTWHEPDRLFGLCDFLVVRRPGSPEGFLQAWSQLTCRGARLQAVDMPPLAVSSTRIRQAVSQAEIPAHLSQGVAAYIGLKGLYGAVPWLPQGSAWLGELCRLLTPQRFAHTLYVTACARQLAQRHGVDVTQATAAALLHDCAKCLKLSRMQALTKGLVQDEATLSSGALLHSAAGASMAQETFGVSDQAVLDAIACHTTGRVGMTPLDMVVFLADKIETSRPFYPFLEEIRALSQADLPRAVLLSLETTVNHVKTKRSAVHPATLQVIAWLKESQHK